MTKKVETRSPNMQDSVSVWLGFFWVHRAAGVKMQGSASVIVQARTIKAVAWPKPIDSSSFCWLSNLIRGFRVCGFRVYGLGFRVCRV
jgi:hypothetical protein